MQVHAAPPTRLGVISRCCSANPPAEAIPATVQHCAVRLGSAPRHCATHSRTAGMPHPRKRTAEPSKGDRRLFCARTGPCRDVVRVRAVTISPVQPSQPLQRHPRRCGKTQRQDIAMPTVVPCAASRQWHPRISMRAATERATPMPPPSKPLLDGYRARHDVPPEAGFARMVVYSVALYATPPHVDKTVWHACKLPSSWPIKGGAVPWPRGDDG
jgi:hypothetical protein